VLISVIAAVVLVGCSGAPAPAGTPQSVARITPHPEPTPTPEPRPWTSGWPAGGLDANWEVLRDLQGGLWDTCYKGTPVPGSAPYAGTVHPLVVMDMDNAWLAYDVDINADFRESGWPWPGPIQLVVCADHLQDAKKIGSCGFYTTEDGKVGEIIRYQDGVSVRVVRADTGKTLQTKVLLGSVPKCPGAKLWVTGNWGWTLTDKVTPGQIDEYATAVSKQPVK
jgi:hypothetical protein